MDWNTDMDEAPRDGTPLILSWQDNATGRMIYVCASWRVSRIFTGLSGFHMMPTGDLDVEYCISKATAWMPLQTWSPA